MAEGVGFEPTRPFGLPVFKTGAINHSTTPPKDSPRSQNIVAASGAAARAGERRCLSRNGWYPGAPGDRLSEEEANIIAARLLRRVQAETLLAKDKAERLQSAVADAFRNQFIDETASQNRKASRYPPAMSRSRNLFPGDLLDQLSLVTTRLGTACDEHNQHFRIAKNF